MSQQVAEKVRQSKLPTIVINDTHRLAPWADALYACDARWWLHHAQAALKFQGLKITHDDGLPWADVLQIQSSGKEGFDPDPAFIRTGNNSGYQALHIAIHAGAKRILLCGYDMKGGHWFGSHPSHMTDADPNVHRNMFIPHFEILAKLLPPLGVEVINCSPDSALECFPKMRLEDALWNEHVNENSSFEKRYALAYGDED